MNATRDQLLPLMTSRGKCDSHPGLLLQRYLHESAAGEHGKPEHKQQILDAAIKSAENPELCKLYDAAFKRWSASLPKDPSPIELRTQGRLIVGLGSENVVETGIRLHHTYGLPIIPGSALKGLAAHYCDQFLGEKNRGDEAPLESKRFRNGWKEEKHDYHKLLFGRTDDSGCIVFHDAWFVPGSEKQPLKLDVMTPHHPDYNRDPMSDPKFRAPTDFDSPIPVPFLSVAGKFFVAVSWHGPIRDQAKNWTELALSLLCDALKHWGVGGKTTSGYGRLVAPPAPAPPPPPRKRPSGAKAKVRLVALRPKGFDVQDVEPGRNPGTLTVGSPPPGADTNLGAVVDVLVHVDDERKPQYKWSQPTGK
jgi:CRISPR-associated protein Cmr6